MNSEQLLQKAETLLLLAFQCSNYVANSFSVTFQSSLIGPTFLLVNISFEGAAFWPFGMEINLKLMFMNFSRDEKTPVLNKSSWCLFLSSLNLNILCHGRLQFGHQQQLNRDKILEYWNWNIFYAPKLHPLYFLNESNSSMFYYLFGQKASNRSEFDFSNLGNSQFRRPAKIGLLAINGTLFTLFGNLLSTPLCYFSTRNEIVFVLLEASELLAVGIILSHSFIVVCFWSIEVSQKSE